MKNVKPLTTLTDEQVLAILAIFNSEDEDAAKQAKEQRGKKIA
jgi:hypothetical protein